MYVYMYVCIHAYMYVYTHTYTYVFIHLHKTILYKIRHWVSWFAGVWVLERATAPDHRGLHIIIHFM